MKRRAFLAGAAAVASGLGRRAGSGGPRTRLILLGTGGGPRPRKENTRRDKAGRFSEQDDVGRASAQDQKRAARNEPPRGQGDRGDRKGR